MNKCESLFETLPCVDIWWIDGSHDGLHQKMLTSDELPIARVCQCHGALYIAERSENGWRLIYTTMVDTMQRDNHQETAK